MFLDQLEIYSVATQTRVASQDGAVKKREKKRKLIKKLELVNWDELAQLL